MSGQKEPTPVPVQNSYGAYQPAQTSMQKRASKEIVMKYSRTFRHYVSLPNDVDNKLKQGWSDIPYQHISASMKPSDWQGLNTFSRKWTPLSCGFVMHHIIPLEHVLTNTGGAITPKVVYQTQPYMEVFTDTGNILPIKQIYTNGLPNNRMSTNSDKPSSSTLQHITWDADPALEIDGHKAFKKQHVNMDLMNSWNWKTILPSDTFQWKWETDETRWRHGVVSHTDNSLQLTASYHGRWDGGEMVTTNKPNNNLTNRLLDNYNKPAPTCLVRPMQIYGNNDEMQNVAFMVLITYTSEVLVKINDVRFFPLFNAIPKDENDSLLDIYKSTHTKQDALKQWAGTNHHNMVTGPEGIGCII